MTFSNHPPSRDPSSAVAEQASVHLTKQENAAYQYICESLQNRGYPPTIREIAEEIGYSSTTSATPLVRRLEAKGLITRDPGLSRTIQVISRPPAGVAVPVCGGPLATSGDGTEVSAPLVLKIMVSARTRRALLAGATLTVERLPHGKDTSFDTDVIAHVTAITHPSKGAAPGPAPINRTTPFERATVTSTTAQTQSAFLPPTTTLAPPLKGVAQDLVHGRSAEEIAARTGRAVGTIRQYIVVIREAVHCPPRCAQPVFVHHLLASGQVSPMKADKPAPVLTSQERLLLRALSEHSKREKIALAAKMAPADVRAATTDLLRKTGAHDSVQLVALAHAWGVLGPGLPTAEQNGSSR